MTFTRDCSKTSLFFNGRQTAIGIRQLKLDVASHQSTFLFSCPKFQCMLNQHRCYWFYFQMKKKKKKPSLFQFNLSNTKGSLTGNISSLRGGNVAHAHIIRLWSESWPKRELLRSGQISQFIGLRQTKTISDISFAMLLCGWKLGSESISF